MRVIKPQALAVLHGAFEHDGRAHLVVIVAAMMDLRATGLDHEQTLWKTLASTPGANGSLDEVKPKVRGEALVIGYAYPPSRRPAPAVGVRLRVGPVDKEVWVIGDRTWQRGAPGDPVPFTEMPLSYDRAFGGRGHAPNPGGKGHAPVELPTGEVVHPLPNLEHPRSLIRSPGERPAPIGLGPIDPSWPVRLAKLGTYDARWQKTRFPGFPEDFDPTYFNVAPEDQWIEGAFRGGEEFALENLHPDQARIEGSLPAIVGRAFAQQRGELQEVQLRCDTVWFVPHLERMILVWRGVFEVADDEAADVSELVAALDWQDRPRPVEHFRRVRELRLDRKRGAVHLLRDGDLVPEGMRQAKLSAAPGSVGSLLETEQLARRNMRARGQRELDEARERARAEGLDPDRHLPRELPPEAPPPDPEDLADILANAEVAAEELKREAEAKREAAMQEAREVCARHGIDYDAEVEAARRASTGPPRFSARAELERLQDVLQLSRNAGVPRPDLVARLTDPDLEEKLVEAEKGLLEAYRRTAHHMPSAYAREGEEAARVRAEVEAALAKGESLAGRDLTGADLAGLDFSGRDLSEAFLEKANLAGCSFRGANTTRAVFTRAILAGADFDGARLAGANLGEADLTGARFTGGLDLIGIVLARATLARADFTGARLDGADLSDARFAGGVFAGVKARRVTVLHGDLRGLDLRGAELVECTLVEVDVEGVDFSGARLAKTTFLDARGEGAIFRRADLANLRVVRARGGSCFARADFRGANLRGANLRGVDLEEADLRGADLTGAELSRCNLRRARLEGVRAAGIHLVKADLTDARLDRADLMNALLGGAVLRGASFEDASVFRADAAHVVGDDRTSFKGANVHHVRVTPPRGDRG